MIAIPILLLAFLLVFGGFFGVLWLMGGVGLNWRDRLIIAISVIFSWYVAGWFISIAASILSDIRALGR